MLSEEKVVPIKIRAKFCLTYERFTYRDFLFFIFAQLFMWKGLGFSVKGTSKVIGAISQGSFEVIFTIMILF